VALDELKIREVSRLGAGVWTPPIGAMGGPPAHELYRDLVLHAGLQLFRDAKARPWVTLQDGAQRRAFPVPSPELRSALDRFRMRRNLRPVPEADIDELVRIVEARISDPDVLIPTLRGPLVERWTGNEVGHPSPPVPDGPPSARSTQLEGQLDSLLRDLHLPTPRPDALAASSDPAPPSEDGSAAKPTAPSMESFDPSVSGGRLTRRPEDGSLPRYVRVFQGLVHDGGWMGTTRELAELTGDDPLTLFDSLLRYHSQLAGNGILVANIEVDDGYRWLAVDRHRVHEMKEQVRPSDLLSGASTE